MKIMLLIKGFGKYGDLVYLIIIFNTRAVRSKVKITQYKSHTII